MKLFFIRHGESEANVLHEFSTRGMRHPLTELGRQQAAAAAEQLRDQQVIGIFSSPLLRAYETARIIGETLQVGVAIADGLREVDVGVLEGKSDDESWAVFARLWDAWFVENRPEVKIEGGESLTDIRARVIPFFNGLAEMAGRVNGNLVVVSHGGIYRSVLPDMVKNMDHEFVEDHPIQNTEIITLRWQPGGWWCESPKQENMGN